MALARTNLDLVQTEINKRIDQKQAVESVGKEYEKNAQSAQAELKTTEQLLQISKDRAETEVKLISYSVKTKEGLNNLELEQAKIRINSTVQSEIQARNLIDGLVVASAQQRIALAETEYMQTRMVREKSFAEQQALYEGMIAKGEKVGESQKGLQELEKARADSQIADSQKLTSAIVQELNTQLKAKDEQVKKIRDLEKQSRDEQVATAEALKGISGAYLTEYGKIAARVNDVGEKLKEATRLVPSMPERALELFQQIRSESNGLVQNIESFNDRLRNAANAGADDPVFSTFAKRLFFFKQEHETDEEFAERLQIPCSRLRGWRYRKHEPSMGDVAHLADVLNVDIGWLGAGRGHYLAIHPGVRVTMIPREPIILYQFVGPDGKPESPLFEEGEMCKPEL